VPTVVQIIPSHCRILPVCIMGPVFIWTECNERASGHV